MASDIVYLYGDSFVAKSSWRGETLRLEASGVKVHSDKLAETMLLAAFAALEQGGWIELPIVKVGLLFKRDTPVLRQGPADLSALAGLEAAIATTIDPRLDWFNTIPNLLLRLIGGKRPGPSGELIHFAREHLVETGHLYVLENPAQGLARLVQGSQKVEANQTLVAASDGEADRVWALLDERRALDARRWELVRKETAWALRVGLQTSSSPIRV
jgi:hypothetical protein